MTSRRLRNVCFVAMLVAVAWSRLPVLQGSDLCNAPDCSQGCSAWGGKTYCMPSLSCDSGCLQIECDFYCQACYSEALCTYTTCGSCVLPICYCG